MNHIFDKLHKSLWRYNVFFFSDLVVDNAKITGYIIWLCIFSRKIWLKISLLLLLFLYVAQYKTLFSRNTFLFHGPNFFLFCLLQFTPIARSDKTAFIFYISNNLFIAKQFIIYQKE